MTDREDSVSNAIANIEYASKLNVPHLDVQRSRPGQCIIVGGAPSIQKYKDDIRILKFQKRNYIIALNWAHTWLIKYGIIPDASIFFEIDVDPLQSLVRLSSQVTYYTCSHCHKRTWEALAGLKTVLWHAKVDSPEINAAQSRFFPGEPLLSGGSTTLIRAIDIGRIIGYRNFELFGCDSSFEQYGPTHIAGYPLEAYKGTGFLEPIKVSPGENEQREFWTCHYLAKQAEQFRQWCLANHSTFLMRVHGDSLLRFLHERDNPEQYG